MAYYLNLYQRINVKLFSFSYSKWNQRCRAFNSCPVVLNPVHAVFSGRYPFKVLDPIVLLIAVYVIDVLFAFKVRKESDCNNPVNEKVMFFPVFEYLNAKVSPIVIFVLQHFPGDLVPGVAVIAYLIQPFKPLNVAPNLFHNQNSDITSLGIDNGAIASLSFVG